MITANADEPTMTSAEFRCLREALGLTNAWLCDYLGVAERSVARWGDGVMAPPPGVVEDMLELQEIARAAVASAVEQITTKQREVWATYRTDAALQADRPQERYPASWHRAIAARIKEHVPDVTIEFAGE